MISYTLEKSDKNFLNFISKKFPFSVKEVDAEIIVKEHFDELEKNSAYHEKQKIRGQRSEIMQNLSTLEKNKSRKLTFTELTLDMHLRDARRSLIIESIQN